MGGIGGSEFIKRKSNNNKIITRLRRTRSIVFLSLLTYPWVDPSLGWSPPLCPLSRRRRGRTCSQTCILSAYVSFSPGYRTASMWQMSLPVAQSVRPPQAETPTRSCSGPQTCAPQCVSCSWLSAAPDLPPSPRPACCRGQSLLSENSLQWYQVKCFSMQNTDSNQCFQHFSKSDWIWFVQP